ncbi:hypothetical protein J1605_015987 [Eschrichtius robustus]|uniref:Uncharacterized protein n=1 Tax=Eschrichtius robustus TaxID=9764 RepID=A0AB34GC85_ESCRO|nr:hypothetical protein J1605_015987 [Eschrichtius robustus]
MALSPCLGSVVHKTNGSAALPWLCPASGAGAGNGEKSLEAGERTPSLPPELSIYQDRLTNIPSFSAGQYQEEEVEMILAVFALNQSLYGDGLRYPILN